MGAADFALLLLYEWPSLSDQQYLKPHLCYYQHYRRCLAVLSCLQFLWSWWCCHLALRSGFGLSFYVRRDFAIDDCLAVLVVNSPDQESQKRELMFVEAFWGCFEKSVLCSWLLSPVLL
jgi:hypothetical protein